MASFFENLLPRSPDAKEGLGQTLSRAKSINEFFADVIDAAKDTDLPRAVVKAAPWAEPLGGAIAEAVPPIRFVIKLFEGLAKIDDPNALGYLACTLAYQESVQQAIPEIKLDIRDKVRSRKILTQLRDATPAPGYDFRMFSYAGALSHPFIRDADQFLKQFAEDLEWDEPTFLQLQHQVHIRFVPNLKILLSHGGTRDKFAPFTALMAQGTEEQRTYAALLQHVDYQRWLFEEKPVLGREPFALQHTYVETDCGKLTWQAIKQSREQTKGDKGEVLNPFREEHGGREPLTETLLDLIADNEFNDAIVIQGVAGSGKSSFTLRLCWELIQQGLQPIRIELKDLDTRTATPLKEALPAAVRITDKDHDPESNKLYFGEKLFRGNEIFEKHVQFRGTKICPYVLILDGWDEISIAASEGYQQRMERMLHDIRETFLSRRAIPVRVILTGRPTETVEQSKFLHSGTVLLTLRPLTPSQLETLVGNMQDALAKKPLEGKDIIPWTLTNVKGLSAVLERYREDFKQAKKQDQPFSRGNFKAKGSLEVLGLPLLALLALRQMAEWPGDIEQLLDNTTTLYRCLVDLVIGKGGKPEEADYTSDGRPIFTGQELRGLLRATAEAMTVLGQENISYEELELRLELQAEELEGRVRQLDEKQALSRLMISFFFKGGYRELGCEFSHKSFREYLFAEQIIETLKDYARQAPEDLPERRTELYWKDFEDGDPRHRLCRALAETLGPQWLTHEVAGHLSRLIQWEIGRAFGENPYPAVGQPTPFLDPTGWERIRDALADLWDWWGEGVHLRPQPHKKSKSREYYFAGPLALEIVKEDRPRATSTCPTPKRIVTIDAHLGDGLFQLAAGVHQEIADRQGWFDHHSEGRIVKTAWEDCSEPGKGPRRYQTRVTRGNHSWTLFAPSGSDSQFFRNYITRINAAGYRPGDDFPFAIHLRSIDLRGVNLRGANLGGANLLTITLSLTGLHAAISLIPLMRDMFFPLVADLSGANLSGASLSGANLSGANLIMANLSGAKLTWANLSGAWLIGADLSKANLSLTNLSLADLSLADLSGADLNGANLSGANLCNARNVTCKQLTDAENWETAYRDSELTCGKEIPKPPSRTSE